MIHLTSLHPLTGEVVRMLITAGAPPDLYRDNPASGALEMGSDAVVDTGLTLARIRVMDQGTQWNLRFNHRGDGTARDYYDPGGPGDAKSIYLHDGESGIEIGRTYYSAPAGGRYANWRGDEASSQIDEYLYGLQQGDRFLLLIADAGQSFVQSGPGRIRASVSSGVPAVSARVRTLRPVRVRSEVSSGVPTVSARVRTKHWVRVRSEASSGVPEITARVRTVRRVRVRAMVSAGAPEVSARVRTRRTLRVRAEVSSGVPTLSARIRTVRSARIRAVVSSGVPTLSARIRADILFRAVQSLLPPNASDLEIAIDGATARVGAVPLKIGDLWNPERCPAAVLPWLA